MPFQFPGYHYPGVTGEEQIDPFGVELMRQWSRIRPPLDELYQYNRMVEDPQWGMNQLYQPQTRASDAYTQLANQFPTRPQPSRLERIGGALAAASTWRPAGHGPAGEPLGFMLGSPQDQEAARNNFMYGDYNRQLGDWGARLKALEPAMTSERYYNANARQIAAETLRREQDWARISETERKNRIAERDRQAKQEAINEHYRVVRQQDAAKQELEWLKWQNPAMRFFQSDATGELVGVNPNTGAKRNFGKLNLSAEDKLRLDVRKAEEIAQFAPNVPLQTTTPQGVTTPFAWNPRTGATEPIVPPQGTPEGTTTRVGTPSRATTGGRQPLLLPTQVAQQQINNAVEFANRNPGLGKFIHIQNDTVKVDPPRPAIIGEGWSSRGPTPEQHQQIMDAIYKTPSGTQNTVPTGWAKMKFPDGSIRRVPMGDVEAMKKAGGTIVP